MINKYKDKKVLIWGLGLNDGGLGMVEFFVKQGAIVSITDGKTKEELKTTIEKLKVYENKITYLLGGHKDEYFLNADIIIRNPAIKPNNQWLKLSEDNNKIIEMEMALFHQLTPTKTIGITGTKGKSTTSSLTHEIIKTKYKKDAILAGNIGVSAIRELSKLTKDNITTLELSSFQLEGMGKRKISPNIAVITNIYPDHLNWHIDMDDYINAKFKIFENQKESDYAVINLDNEITKELINRIHSSIITYSLKDSKATYYTNSEGILFENTKEVLDLSTAKLQGKHNWYNITASVAVARIEGVEFNKIQEVINTFKGIPNRQEFVRELNGITFINDTTATAVQPITAALETFGKNYSKRIIMIAGGIDKGFDYSELEPIMRKHLKALVLLDGTASEKIAKVMKDSNIDIHKFFLKFEEAINTAYSLANEGDLIILCPGGSSFNMFINEWDRGEQFVKIVNQLK